MNELTDYSELVELKEYLLKIVDFGCIETLSTYIKERIYPKIRDRIAGFKQGNPKTKYLELLEMIFKEADDLYNGNKDQGLYLNKDKRQERISELKEILNFIEDYREFIESGAVRRFFIGSPNDPQELQVSLLENVLNFIDYLNEAEKSSFIAHTLSILNNMREYTSIEYKDNVSNKNKEMETDKNKEEVDYLMDNMEYLFYSDQAVYIESIDYCINELERLHVEYESVKHNRGFKAKINPDQIDNIYYILKDNSFINEDTDKDHFKAVFKQRELPEGFTRIDWIGSQRLLIWFIKVVMNLEKTGEYWIALSDCFTVKGNPIDTNKIKSAKWQIGESIPKQRGKELQKLLKPHLNK